MVFLSSRTLAKQSAVVVPMRVTSWNFKAAKMALALSFDIRVASRAAVTDTTELELVLALLKSTSFAIPTPAWGHPP
jgi:hypothetical protein